MEVINEKDFDTLVKNSKDIVIVDFFATWCGPCRMIAQELDDACEELKIKGYKVDVDESETLARNHGVMAVPTVYLYKNGEPVDHFSGYMQKDEIVEFINKNK